MSTYPLITWVDDDLKVELTDEGPEAYFGLAKRRYRDNPRGRCYGMDNFTLRVTPGKTEVEIWTETSYYRIGEVGVWSCNPADGRIYFDPYGRCKLIPSGDVFTFDEMGFIMVPSN